MRVQYRDNFFVSYKHSFSKYLHYRQIMNTIFTMFFLKKLVHYTDVVINYTVVAIDSFMM